MGKLKANAAQIIIFVLFTLLGYLTFASHREEQLIAAIDSQEEQQVLIDFMAEHNCNLNSEENQLMVNCIKVQMDKLTAEQITIGKNEGKGVTSFKLDAIIKKS